MEEVLKEKLDKLKMPRLIRAITVQVMVHFIVPRPMISAVRSLLRS